jgi:hypothetical protein
MENQDNLLNEAKAVHDAAPHADPAANDVVVDRWVSDTFHGSAVGRELSAESHNTILAAAIELKKKLRAS